VYELDTMTHLPERPYDDFNDQEVILEDLQMRQAEALIQVGLLNKGIMHIVERANGAEVEDSLLSGLPLILESSNGEQSFLYLGIRFVDHEGEIKTKLVQLGKKTGDEDSYLPIEMTRFTKQDCLFATHLLAEVLGLKETVLPDYNPEIGFLSQA
jgi:hypothetical protein